MRRRLILTESEEESSVNLTPLIDVVFLVLIMFILVAPIVELDKVNLAAGLGLEQNSVESFEGKHKVIIHVRKDNSILLNAKSIESSDLLFLFREMHRIHPDETPQLFHDKDASFGTYQSIKNALEEAGFTSMDVILNPR